MVPQPDAGEQINVLFGDGDWDGLALVKGSNGYTSLCKGTNGQYTVISSAQTGGSKTVLWTNSSPDSSFSAQTIPLSSSASNFDFLLFEYYYSTTGQQLQTQLVGADFTGTIGLRIVQAGANRTGGRNVTVSGTSVVFDDAYFNTAATNSNVIPYRIIGIKM